jgi:putative ABC transport system permease protein
MPVVRGGGAAAGRVPYRPYSPGETDMLENYLRVALRGLYRQRGYTAINLLGLAVGIACCLLIGLFVRHELTYDRHHEHGERIVRVDLLVEDTRYPLAPNIVAPLVKREIPEVEEAVRLLNVGAVESVVVQWEDRMFEEGRFFFADSTIFDVFTLPLLSGNPALALNRPLTIVLTETTARKYFDDADPLGQTVRAFGTELEVTGVLAPLPEASHLQFDFLASFTTLSGAREETWQRANYHTYLLLREGVTPDGMMAQLDRLVDRAEAAGEMSSRRQFVLAPLHTIHLDVGGRRAYVYLFSAIAVLILLIACVNYMNLATARAMRRAKEVGVRKATGAHRSQLVGQFYSESALLAVLSLAAAAALAAALAPTFRAISGQPLRFSLLDPFVPLALLAVGVVVTLVAGSYPALLLSSFRPAQALKGSLQSGPGATTLRRGLVTFQFAVSVFLLVGTSVIFNQLRYVQTTDLGFQGEQVLALPASGPTQQQIPALKRRLDGVPGVVSTVAIDRLPGTEPGGWSLTAEGFELPEGMDYYPIHGIPTEPGVVEVLGLELLAGSDLRDRTETDPEPGQYTYLINEAVLRATGWTPEEAIGKRFSVYDDDFMGTVVGVIRDYHFLPLHEAVGPLALFVMPTQLRNLLARTTPDSPAATLAGIEAVWQEMIPDRPFTYSFLDEAFAQHYERERQLGRLLAAFALLAVLIACLGLLGLAAYAAERRRKEIGVRKVLGAGVGHVVVMLSKEFALLVAIGFAVAAPLAYWAMSRWLEAFAYRITLGPAVFLLAGGVVLLLALATVAGQALRAATADPVRALRSE